MVNAQLPRKGLALSAPSAEDENDRANPARRPINEMRFNEKWLFMRLLSSLPRRPSRKKLGHLSPHRLSTCRVDLGLIRPRLADKESEFMKKLLVKIAVILAVLVVLAIVGVAMFLNSIIKQGVETAGPKVAQVAVKLDDVNLSLFSGKGEIRGLVVGNPAGFQTPNAIKMGKVDVAVRPGSVFSDKIIIESISVEAPEITLEGGLQDNNLTKILANIESFASKGGTSAAHPGGDQSSKSAKKLQVNDFTLTGGKIILNLAILGGNSTVVALPDIHFKDLGQGPAGITPEDLVRQILQAATDHALKAAAAAARDQGKAAIDKAVGPGAADSIGKATKGIGDLFKKKKE
jgi:hypothetical protein